MWEDGQGVLCLVDAAFASLNLHFLVSYHLFYFSLPLPFIIQSLFSLAPSLLMLIFVILPLVFGAVPVP